MQSAFLGTTRRALARHGHAAVLAAFALACTARAHEVAAEMTGAATNLLATFTPEQKAKAMYPFEDHERRNWHFIPRQRLGLPLKEMNSAQQHLAHALLNSGLSHRGYLKATTIMSLEQVLKDLEQGKGPVRDPELYYLTFFGEPSTNRTWGWRVEGHHLSLNFTLVEGRQIEVTPSFFGSNPGQVRSGPRSGLRVLGTEEDLGRALVRSLTEEQRGAAIISATAPADIISGPDRQAKTLAPEGLSAERMDGDQRRQVRRLVEEYVRRYRPELADEDLEKIRAAGWERIHFAWAGGIEPGQGHYYRVQGPTFILEYDNTQNDANHIHTVWRDFQNDFGEDLLRQHYLTTPHPQ